LEAWKKDRGRVGSKSRGEKVGWIVQLMLDSLERIEKDGE